MKHNGKGDQLIHHRSKIFGKRRKMKQRGYSKRIAGISRSAIHEMTRLSREVDDVVLLSWARPSSDTPEHIKEAAVKAIKDRLAAAYSESSGLYELRGEIAKKLIKVNDICAEPSQVLVTVGAMEGSAAAVMALTDPGDEVILPTPTYSAHISQIALAAARPVLVPLDEKENYALDLDAIKRAVTTKTRAIFYCSPSNPTGAVFSEEQLRSLAEIAIDHDLAIITDEAYEHFVYDGARHFSIASIPELSKRVVSCFTFTKTYSMTGWRVGYLHAYEDIARQISKAHIPLALCAPVVSQYAALAAIRGPQDCIGRFREKYRKSRDLLCSRLDGLSGVFSYRRPEGAYLMFPKILAQDGADSTAFCRRLLTEARVSFSPGVEFGPNGEGHARISFCVPEEEINRAFDRLEKYFKV